MITTNHKLIIGDSRNIEGIPDGSIDLVVTSPPYPMIEMWDEIFSLQNPQVGICLKKGEQSYAFELMHKELDKVWNEVGRILRRNGIACVNIGDATRTFGNLFQIFTNHARILQHFIQNDFVALPCIIWRKQTNSPNKFMGSGMLPPGAYVTLEHEYILIFRKGGKREFKSPAEKQIRQSSAYFWEERNTWFSDVWEGLKGVDQKINNSKTRNRSAAYPFELAHRLINMFSVKGDTVLDPFVGTGTTMFAAMCNQRNSVGVEIDDNFETLITSQFGNIVSTSNEVIANRLRGHQEFVQKRVESGKDIKHRNVCYGFPVITKQESGLQLNFLSGISKNDDFDYTVSYKKASINDLTTPLNNFSDEHHVMDD